MYTHMHTYIYRENLITYVCTYVLNSIVIRYNNDILYILNNMYYLYSLCFIYQIFEFLSS